MDLNQSKSFITSSNSDSSQVPNLVMPMGSNFTLPGYLQQTKQDTEEVRRSEAKKVLNQNLELFWNQQLLEMQTTSVGKSHHQLPLARIKRIMKSEGDVKMISADTPLLFSKACELFIMELTLRSWMQTEECKRRTLQRCDIAIAVRNNELPDFLVDVVPISHDHHCHKFEKVSGKTSQGNASVGAADQALNHPIMMNSFQGSTTTAETIPMNINQEILQQSMFTHQCDHPMNSHTIFLPSK